MINARNWLESQEKYNTKEKRSEIKELNIREKELEGDLDLSDFRNLEKLDCLRNKFSGIKVVNLLNLTYFNAQINELNSIEIINCPNIAYFDIGNNKITDFDFSSLVNPKKITFLNIGSNNFKEQNLSFLERFTNLEELYLDSIVEWKIKQGIYNRFIGSLDYLSGMKQLRKLNISNTDLSEINFDKLSYNLEQIYYSTELRPNCKLTEIVPQLKNYKWEDIHTDFSFWFRRKWEGMGFNKNQTKDWINLGFEPRRYEKVGGWKERNFNYQQTKEWMQVGLEPKDYNFVSWLRDVKNLSSQGFLVNKDKENYQKSRERCNSFDWCHKCRQPNTGNGWCKFCNSQYFQQDFKQWTSGNREIDEFIQKSQLEASNQHEVLEWIPYEKFTDIEYLAEGGFGKVYKAKWIDGWISYWNVESNKWERRKDKYTWEVALKSLNNSQDTMADFLRESSYHKNYHKLAGSNIDLFIPYYGISQDPRAGNYLMVMSYMVKGDLRKNLSRNLIGSGGEFYDLYWISHELSFFHKMGLIHRDFHPGNILLDYRRFKIADFGLCQPVNENDKGKVFGVLPYVAPEVLRGQSYTQASDIYSFGIVIYEILTGLFPYYELNQDEFLGLKICQGLRPRFNVKIPKLLENLVNKCWNADPNQRPTAEELTNIFLNWHLNTFGNANVNKKDPEFVQQYRESKEYNQKLPKEIRFSKYETYKKNTYHSRLINTKRITELLENTEYSENLAFDFTNLKVEENNSDWTTLPNFTPEQIQQWTNLSFTPSQTQDYLSIGLQPHESNFATYLRDHKHLTPETALNQADYEQLKEEYQSYQTEQEQPPK